MKIFNWIKIFSKNSSSRDTSSSHLSPSTAAPSETKAIVKVKQISLDPMAMNTTISIVNLLRLQV
ncbi:hypothetical protein BOX15_Mlig005387g1 [Macrostomum lignano]|uniref:Uncharacterized protein n=1 Tax=Macrostomum lignano TaxID=282301 RepID=A0A267G8R7_9PLAT|nr:hypothetical protein BOX15_Mlig007945g8 [Macrostomum lignano]PAA82411.1 hypothetical protein BOX15_Mlig005387g1 [Macrostomum lignano]